MAACLRKPNVELVRTGIERIVADGVVTVDGTHHPADVICYATGFRHNDFLAPMRRHRQGRGPALRDQWGDEPTAYLGITDAATSPTCSASTVPAPTWPTAPASSSSPSARSTT